MRTLRYFGNQRPFQRLLPGLEAYYANRSAARDQEYAEFLQKWSSWRQEGLWDRLVNEVTARCLVVPPSPAEIAADASPASEQTESA